MKESLKSKLKKLIFPVVATGVFLGSYLHFYLTNNWEDCSGNREWHYYQKMETKGFFTKNCFVSWNDGVSKEREAFYETLFLRGGKSYSDSTDPDYNNRDGLIDEIVRYQGLFCGERIELTRAEHYQTHKAEFDEADKSFAKIRGPYIERMKKLLTN